MARPKPGRPVAGKFPQVPVLLHDRIRFEREVMGWTQAQLGAAIGRENISEIERGLAQVTVELASRIADALGITLVRITGHLRPPESRPKSITGSPAAA